MSSFGAVGESSRNSENNNNQTLGVHNYVANRENKGLIELN